jgi:hypothetical protein
LSDDDVNTIKIDGSSSSSSFFFPRGIENVFKNLNAIEVVETHLKEIHKCDMKPFPKLQFLSLHSNDLEVIEADLFKYNEDLEWIWLNNNKITHIDAKVFDSLSQLREIFLYKNPCKITHGMTNSYANTTSDLQELITRIQSKKCFNSNQVELSNSNSCNYCMNQKDEIIGSERKIYEKEVSYLQAKNALKMEKLNENIAKLQKENKELSARNAKRLSLCEGKSNENDTKLNELTRKLADESEKSELLMIILIAYGVSSILVIVIAVVIKKCRKQNKPVNIELVNNATYDVPAGKLDGNFENEEPIYDEIIYP